MPIFSMGSFDLLRPAVSTIIIGMPPTIIWRCIESLVVPAYSVTIDASSSDKRFIKVDLPTLGSPTKTTLAPSLRRLP